MKTKRTCLIFAVLFWVSVVGAWASPTTPEQAREVVSNWLKLDSQPLGDIMGHRVREIETFAGPDGAPAYYVVYLDVTGFVIVAADDTVEPIVAFIQEGIFYDPSDANPLGALVSNDVPGRVLHARQTEALSLKTMQLPAAESPMAKAQRKWAWLADPDAAQENLEFGVAALSEVRVAPFVQSLWSQTTVGSQACYNYYTPPYAEGNADNYPCGCVATAMAQLLHYWQHPSSGVGTRYFPITVDGAPQSRLLRGGNGSGGPYDWVNMVPVPSSPTVAQCAAIGSLTHDAGLSVNMTYTASGSAANLRQAANAFTGVFGYSNAMTAYDSSRNLPESNRDRMVNPNLHARYPVLFGVTRPGGGHAIVCDGYGYQASTVYHHINLGWGGSDDAWYNLPSIDTSHYDYNSVDECVYNVYPTGSGEIVSGRVTTAGGNPIHGAAVTASRSGGGTYTGETDANGIYAIARVPSNSSYSVSVQKAGYTFTPQSTTTGTSINDSTTTGNVADLDFVGSGGPAEISYFAINAGAPSTTSVLVTLNNTVTGSTPVSCMASESVSFSGVSWQPYSSAPSFSVSGSYGVKTIYFKVQNALGESEAISDTIELMAPPDFDAVITTGKVPLKVPFIDKSVGTITSWLWDFGNGKTSKKQNPVHTYRKPGSYTVTLTATGPTGSGTVTRTAYINAYAAPKANFSAVPGRGFAPLQVSFVDKSKGSISSRAWDFGDSQSSNEPNPSHSFAVPGTYTATLTVTGPVGTSSKTKKVSVKALK